MKNRPIVSVIMPAYCASSTIEASVDCLKNQILQNWELIVVDDGSPDETAAIVESLARSDARIRLIRQKNAGPSAARNTGVLHARAETLAFLDADDLWASERLEGMVSALASAPSAGVVFSRTRFVDAETLKPGTLTPHRSCLNASDLMAENAVCSTSNIVCRDSVFRETGGFATGLHYAEDQDWLLRVALMGRWAIHGVDAEWFFYRSSENSQSSDLEAMRLGWLRMVERARVLFPEPADAAVRCAVGPIHRQLARRALRMGQARAAFRYLWMALQRDPLLIARQPKRTLLTLAGACLSLIPHPNLKELVVR